MSQQPESGSVQPNVNPGGTTAHQPQLSEARIAANEISTGEHLNYYRPLYLAAQRGDWKTAESFIEHDPNALTAQITAYSQTALHIAAFCSQWGFILKLLELLSPESVVMQDEVGCTVLHFVAIGGSLKTAIALVAKNNDLPQITNNQGELPLLFSIWSESKELVWYLALKTRVESPSFPFFISPLPKIIRNLLQSGYHDIALYFVRRYHYLALSNDEFGNSMLCWLACEPSHFFSGSNLGFLKRWIYKCKYDHILQFYLNASPIIKMVRDTKLKHECAVELVNHVCMQLSRTSYQQITQFLQNPTPILGNAVRGGVEEVVRILLQNFPDLISYNVFLVPGRNILQAAVEYRQENIVNTIKDISPTATKNLSWREMESRNTTLHLAGRLAPASKLFSVSGAALQMQRELQWFKEVEKIAYPFLREWKNINDETATYVFRMEHKELAEQGEKWMKDTANSCMLVSALIATVLFAAAFTVPGGNVDDNGIPIFLRTNAFTVFVISDALGLFSSLTSLLMFLAILTARYAVEDFLKSLPKKLIIGLGSLFFAIAAMIIAFGATLTIVLDGRWHWVSMPITLVASFPVAIFVMLQLPLFIQMIRSTYGASIFHPWPSRV
ncbi:hypothetical protein Dsin_014184 [Dipteronia sinensis]|uniref:PGG domain-containing protein n=1 Tax=Dipteronia sinensis TaxID=43782 RepID=A0AAE0AML0_9ROSI|nr:hypothetical protein Dsin_014184 [Dipteronia sinensis]